MDMRMPIMDGYDATKRIKESPNGANVIIIALSASSLKEERALALNAGCDDFMRKPIQHAQLFDMMQQHLGVQYLYQENKPSPSEKEASQQPTTNNQSTFDPDWLANLEEAALILDQDHMLSLIEQIRDTAPALATQLEEWVNDFEYEQIVAWVEEQKRVP